MKTPIVAFDESGNTGADLLNQDQPIFTLASVCFTDHEANQLANILKSPQSQEIRFQGLKRRRPRQSKIIKFLRHRLIRPEKVKVSIVHKKFMVVTKIVDLLIEPDFYRRGIDFYEKGHNIATSNMLFLVLPTMCGESAVDDWLYHFVRMIRFQTSVNVEMFYRQSDLLINRFPEDTPIPVLDIISSSRLSIDNILRAFNELSLDPAIPCFVQHCVEWGKELKTEFDVYHDVSKPLARDKELLKYLMARDEKEIEVGYDRRKVVYPLKANGIQFVDSKNCLQVQLADLISSVLAYWCRGLLDKSEARALLGRVGRTESQRNAIRWIMANNLGDPKGTGTDEEGGISPIDHVEAMVARQRTKNLGV
jgi:hypothetical protein